MKDSQLSRRRLALFWAIAMALSLTLVLCGAEVLLRLALSQRFTAETDAPLVASRVPGPGYELAPNWHGSVETDARGLRSRAPDAEPPRYKVLLIGDSVTFGSGVRYEDAFGSKLETMLNRGLGRSVAVWNAGVPGYNTTQEELALRHMGPLVQPDLVLVQVCMNDYMAAPVLTPGKTLDATHMEGGGGFSLVQLLYRSRVFVLVKEKLKDQEKRAPERFPKWMHYISHLKNKPGWAQVKESLVKMKADADSLHARLVVVVFPVEEQLRIPDHSLQDDLGTFLELHGIAMLDLFPAFKAHWPKGLYVDYWEQTHQVDKLHPNARGHELAAKTIASTLLSRSPEYFTP